MEKSSLLRDLAEELAAGRGIVGQAQRRADFLGGLVLRAAIDQPERAVDAVRGDERVFICVLLAEQTKELESLAVQVGGGFPVGGGRPGLHDGDRPDLAVGVALRRLAACGASPGLSGRGLVRGEIVVRDLVLHGELDAERRRLGIRVVGHDHQREEVFTRYHVGAPLGAAFLLQDDRLREIRREIELERLVQFAPRFPVDAEILLRPLVLVQRVELDRVFLEEEPPAQDRSLDRERDLLRAVRFRFGLRLYEEGQGGCEQNEAQSDPPESFEPVCFHIVSRLLVFRLLFRVVCCVVSGRIRFT